MSVYYCSSYVPHFARCLPAMPCTYCGAYIPWREGKRWAKRYERHYIFPTAMKPTFAKAVTARIGFCGISVIENRCFGILPRRRQVSSGSSNAGDANTSGITRGRCGTLDISLHSRCGGKVTSCDYRTSRRDTQTVVAALLVLDVLGMVFVADAREPILSTFR